jgi:hypothetical protein
MLLSAPAAAGAAATAASAVTVQRGPGVGGGAGTAHEARPAAGAAGPPPQHRAWEQVSGSTQSCKFLPFPNSDGRLEGWHGGKGDGG